MNCKKYLLVPAFLMMLAATPAAAQLYLGFSAGYGLPANRMWLGTNVEDNGSVETYEVVNSSLGQGLQAGLFIGSMTNNNVGLELGLSYLQGAGVMIRYTDNAGGLVVNEERVLMGRMIRVVPGLRFTTGAGDVRPYGRAGLILGVGGKVIEELEGTYTAGGVTDVEEYVFEEYGGFSVGFSGAAGVNFQASDRLSLFAELGLVYQNWAPEKGRFTKYTINGADALGGMTTSEKEVDYVNELTVSGSAPPAGNPDEQLKIFRPFSSAGVNLGLVLHFGSVE